jgi:hypothetical protein
LAKGTSGTKDIDILGDAGVKGSDHRKDRIQETAYRCQKKKWSPLQGIILG